MKKALFALAALAVMAVSPALTQAGIVYSLADLIANNTVVQSGDKLFDNWSYSEVGDMPDPANIGVEAILVNGNYGIRFTGLFTDLAGGGASDALIGFRVTAPAQIIRDAHLFANPFAAPGGGNIAAVTESFAQEPDKELDVFNDGTNSVTEDGTVFDNLYTSINVLKDIFVRTANDNTANPSTITVIDQTFSQVPEPATIVLLSVCGLGLAGRRLRRRDA